MEREVPARTLWLTLTGLVLVVIVWLALVSQVGAPVPATGIPPPPTTAGPKPAAPPETAETVVRLHPEQVLATVNHHEIRVGDALPASGTNQEIAISSRDLKFFLHRAVQRELIFEAASKQGIDLDESQNQQLANMQAMRNQPEPGGIARMNSDPASQQMETLDARAFMLQTAIMAARGASPNVSEDQVRDYFQQHASDFANLPGQPSADNPAWQDLDFQIRNRLAASVRSNYNQELAAFMQQMESSADLVLFF